MLNDNGNLAPSVSINELANWLLNEFENNLNQEIIGKHDHGNRVLFYNDKRMNANLSNFSGT